MHTPQLDETMQERQWIITQARKGRITEQDMELQLGQLQIQEWDYRRELSEYEGLLAARTQSAVLTEWADKYLGDIHAGIAALEIEIEHLFPYELEVLVGRLA